MISSHHVTSSVGITLQMLASLFVWIAVNMRLHRKRLFSAHNLGCAASRHEGLSSGHACVPAVAPGLSYESCFFGALGSERKIIQLSLVPLRATENSHWLEDKATIINLFTFLFP